jgi:hypothetical protein
VGEVQEKKLSEEERPSLEARQEEEGKGCSEDKCQHWYEHRR